MVQEFKKAGKLKSRVAKVAFAGAIAVSSTLTANVHPAAAATVPVTLSCGSSAFIGLPGDTYQLAANVSGCTANGIQLDGGGYTFDLNGKEVSCVDGSAGDGWGIRIRGANITIIDSSNPKTGVVKFCDSGIKMDASGVISGGNGGNTVDGIKIYKNQGSQCLTTDGDGIVVDTSSGNTLKNNTITENGPYGGVTVLGASNGNTIINNVVSDNAWPVKCTNSSGTKFYYYESDGIRLEPHTHSNTVKGNTVERNGLDGIAVFPLSKSNVIDDNDVNANGTPVPPAATGYTFAQARFGDGVRVFDLAEGNAVKNNSACGNEGNGIHGGLGGNVFLDNNAGTPTGCADNHTGGASSGSGTSTIYYFDLHDPDNCANVWKGNTGAHNSGACTTA